MQVDFEQLKAKLKTSMSEVKRRRELLREYPTHSLESNANKKEKKCEKNTKMRISTHRQYKKENFVSCKNEDQTQKLDKNKESFILIFMDF